MTERRAHDMPAPPATAAPLGSGPRVLVFTTLFPNPAQPLRGVFVAHRVLAVAQHCPTRVVAPILQRGRRFGVAAGERYGDVEVSHPPYATLPLLARCADGAMLYRQVLPHVQRLRAEFPFAVIDAHYAFPDGAAAIRLAAHFRVPVTVTVRGGDLDLLPRYRFRRRAIAHTLRRADRIFAVSEHLAARAVALGASPAAVLVVPNGVDPALFCYGDRAAARRELGIPAAQRLVLCVGNLLAEKGQHLLVEAVAAMGSGADAAHAVLIGSDRSPLQAYRARLERLIAQHGVADRVRLLGSVAQAQLAQWYRAADVLVQPTMREGGPNVIREALSCGTPVVASRVGAVPELLTSDRRGLLVAPGDAAELVAAVRVALRMEWDRAAIAAELAGRGWDAVGSVIATELTRLARHRTERPV